MDLMKQIDKMREDISEDIVIKSEEPVSTSIDVDNIAGVEGSTDMGTNVSFSIYDEKSNIVDLDIDMEGFSQRVSSVDKRDYGDMEYYKEKMRLKEPINIQFSQIDLYDNLGAFDGSIAIKMYNHSIKGNRYKIVDKASELAKVYPVLVTGINEEKQQVTVSHMAVKDAPRKEALRLIDEKLMDKKMIHATGTITNVIDRFDGGKMKQMVYIDLWNLGIVGAIRIKEWANAYTSSLTKSALIGETVDVIITGKHVTVRDGGNNVKITNENAARYSKSSRRVVFDCSRRLYHKFIKYDPWDVVIERLRPNMSVRFKIVEVNREKRTFFAEIDGIKNFNAIGNFPDGEDVAIGSEYLGYVAKIKADTHYLRVRISEKINDVTSNWKDIDSGRIK